MNAFVPAITDPTGAPSPFDKQNITESTFRVITATWSPSAVAALKIRAPSRCTFNPILSAWSQISSTCAVGYTFPQTILLAFSPHPRPLHQPSSIYTHITPSIYFPHI